MREKNGRERKREKQSEKLERKRNIERRRKKQRKREGEIEREIRRSIISKVLYDFFKSNSSVGDNSVSENALRYRTFGIPTTEIFKFLLITSSEIA